MNKAHRHSPGESASPLEPSLDSPRSVVEEGSEWSIIDFSTVANCSAGNSGMSLAAEGMQQASEPIIKEEAVGPEVGPEAAPQGPSSRPPSPVACQGECLADMVLCQPLQMPVAAADGSSSSSSTGAALAVDPFAGDASSGDPQPALDPVLSLSTGLGTHLEDATPQEDSSLLHPPVDTPPRTEAAAAAAPLAGVPDVAPTSAKWSGSLRDVPAYAWGLLTDVFREAARLHTALSRVVQYVCKHLLNGAHHTRTGASLMYQQYSQQVLSELGTVYRRAVDELRGKLATVKGSQARWMVLSVGASLTAVAALAALTHQVHARQHLQVQLEQRDRELAGLVVKILNLQDLLQHSARGVPLLCHTSLHPHTMYPSALAWL